MEQARKVQRERLALAAMDANQVLMLWVRPGGEIAFVNEATARELGTVTAALEGASVEALGSRFERDFREALTRLEPGHRVRFESEGLHRDGTPVPLGFSVLEIEQAGEKMFSLLGADIRAQRETQEALRDTQEMLFQAQKMEAIGRLAGGVAHDFNNLLAVIVGSVELLDAGGISEADATEIRSEIREAAGRGARLTRQLLAFSRQQIVAPTVQAPSRLLHDLEKMLQRVLGADVALKFEVLDADSRIRIDPSQLEQVLLNLAVNARDAMPGGGELAVRVARTRIAGPVSGSRDPVPHGEYVRIEVSDTGMGMTPEIEHRVFEPFFSTKERGKGTGLGLATVYGIVRQAGGYIGLRTKSGQGTTFQLLFPRVEESSGELRLSEPAVRPGDANRRILYVEDDRELRRLTARILGDMGHQVLVARDSWEALQLAASSPAFDLLLTDVVLPGINGLDLAKLLAADRPELRVMFVSGYAEDADVLREIVEGNRLLLPKPFSRSALTQAIAQALRRPPFLDTPPL